MARRIAIIGAGIVGLTTAWKLRQAGHEVTVLEYTHQPGGAIQTTRHQGFTAERGPNSMLLNSPDVRAFIHEAGLGNDLIEANTAAKKRFVLKDGVPTPLPMSPGGFLRTSLFSPRAKLRLLREPFIRPAPADAHETMAAITRRRLGSEFLDYAVGPFVSGVFAGDPARLVARWAFPKLWRLEQEHHSFIRGAIAKSRQRRKLAGPQPQGTLVSFRGGLQTFPQKLAADLGPSLWYGVTVRSLNPVAEGWQIRWEVGGEARHANFDDIVLTPPAWALPHLPLPGDMDLAPLLAVPHPPVTIVSLGYPREAVAHPLDGFGMLIPKVENRRILGAIFASTLFPDRAPDDHVLLNVFVGGRLAPDEANLPDDQLLPMVQEELREILGATGAPAWSQVTRWPQAIPQYEGGHGAVLAHCAALEERWRGLHFAGNYRHGISVVQGCEAGLRIADSLNRA